MAEIWFSSDLHLYHDRIIEYCQRPFSSGEEMVEVMIEKHNAVVRPQDHYYNLGDVVMWRGNHNIDQFNRLIARFHGHKRLILGNHDHYPVEVYLRAGFEKVMAMQMFDGLRFTHIPIHGMSMGRATANIHGHIHEKPAPPPVIRDVDDDGQPSDRRIQPYVNICVEMTEYAPVNLEQVKQLVKIAKEG